MYPDDGGSERLGSSGTLDDKRPAERKKSVVITVLSGGRCS